jgi:hypothetical protein
VAGAKKMTGDAPSMKAHPRKIMCNYLSVSRCSNGLRNPKFWEAGIGEESS